MAKTVLGIDFGAKRVGLAVAAPGQRPQRLATIANDQRLLAALGEVLATQEAQVAAVGLPRNLDGHDTPQTALARRFAAGLQQAQPELAVVLQDEAVTTELARQRLQAEGVAAKDIPSLLDQEAAVIIAEDYIHGR